MISGDTMTDALGLVPESEIRVPAGRPMLRVCFIHCPDPTYADTQNYGSSCRWAYTLAAHIRRTAGSNCAVRHPGGTLIPWAPPMSSCSRHQPGPRQPRPVQKELSAASDAVSMVGGPSALVVQPGRRPAQARGVRPSISATATGDRVPARRSPPRQAGERDEDKARFEIKQARLYRPLRMTIHRYYGAVLEVSRGCPFLCEFCDTDPPGQQPAHNNRVKLIVERSRASLQSRRQTDPAGVRQFHRRAALGRGGRRRTARMQARTGHREPVHLATINLYSCPP